MTLLSMTRALYWLPFYHLCDGCCDKSTISASSSSSHSPPGPRYSNQTLSLSVSLCLFLFPSLFVCLFLISLSLSLSLSLPVFLSSSHTSYFQYFLARSSARSLPGSVHLNHEFLTITYRQYYLIRRGGVF